MSEENLITISGDVDTTVYGKGDTCLLLNPFDTFHLFKVYNNWLSDSKVPMNLANSNQKIFLIFKSKKKEVRINEYVNVSSNYNVDKSNGEVLFKITKEDYSDISTLGNRTFYIVRRFDEEDNFGNITYSSSEEVLFIGSWEDESNWRGMSLSATIKMLRKNISDLENENLKYVRELAESKLKIESLTNINNSLQERVDSLQAENDKLVEELSQYENANEFTSVVISDNATYNYYIGDTEVDENGKVIEQVDTIQKSSLTASSLKDKISKLQK